MNRLIGKAFTEACKTTSMLPARAGKGDLTLARFSKTLTFYKNRIPG
jgi:hypothetical protein